MKEAMLYEELPKGRVRCHLCGHRCVIAEGRLGVCSVRKNVNGKLYTLVYGRTVSRHVDPIEKKPFFHFYPGSTAYSIATPGCNFHCRWCQNWSIVRPPDEERLLSILQVESERIVCARLDIVMPVLIEINSGREARKTGVLPEDLDDLVDAVAGLEHLDIQGLMTMGPRFGDPEQARPYFRATRKAFERVARRDLPGVTMRTLSMGMSNSYRLAIEEGANLVRIGSRIFGSVVAGT